MRDFRQREPVTDPLVPAMVELLRQKTPAEKLAMTAGMWRSARRMLWKLVRSQHPNWSNDQVTAEVARSMSQREA